MRRWTPWVLGTIAALYVNRVFVEFAPLGWPAGRMWGAGLLLGLLAFAIAVVVHAFGCQVAPLAALAVYLVSPTIDSRLAITTGIVAGLGVLIPAVDHLATEVIASRAVSFADRFSAGLMSDAGVFLISSIVYIATSSPGLLPADSGEFQLIAPTLGIAHPPGYALYTLVGKLFTLISVSTPAYRLNLLSSVLAAATLLLVNRTTRQLTESTPAGLIAVLALAGAATFWAQATTANIRMPTAFFAALVLWLVVRYGDTRMDRDLVFAAFAFGLGLTHHGSLAFLALPATLYVLWTEPDVLRKGRLLAKCAVAFSLSLLVLLYFPIRGAAGAPLDPGGLTTLDGFLDHVLARGFRGDVLAFTGRRILLNRLRVLLNILTIQFGWAMLLLAGVALIPPLPRSPIVSLRSSFTVPRWALLAAGFALTAGVVITYRAPQTVEYLMPAYVPLVILIGVGAARLVRLIPSSALRAIAFSVALVLGLINVWQVAPSYRELSRRSDTRQVVEPILRDAPRNAKILSNWHWATALWYLQTVEGMRRDVDVEYVAPAGAEPYPETWRRSLVDALDGPPVIVTNRYRTYADVPARLVPFYDAFQATTAPIQMPDDASRLNASFGDSVGLLGYTISTTRLRPGEDLTVRLWWRPLADAQRDYSVFVHLVDASSRPVGQADVRYPASRLTRGTLIEDAYTLSILPTVPPGEYSAIAGFYFTPPEGGFQRLTVDGDDSIRLDNVNLVSRQSPPMTQHRIEVPFADGPTLLGANYDTSRPGSTRIYLHWRTAPAGFWSLTLTRGGVLIAEGTVPAGGLVTTAVDVPPDTTHVDLEVSDTNGHRLPARGAWRLPALGSVIQLPRIRADDRYLVFGGEMALVGVDWRVDGDEVVVDLDWLSLRPLVRDYTVSVQLLGDSGWRAQADGTPSLGAIPTLKWIRGTHVVDRHRVKLPAEAVGPANLQVSVYDAFTQAPLGVLDDRFQRVGQGEAAVVERLMELPVVER